MEKVKREWVVRMHVRGLATFYADRDGQPNDYDRAADFDTAEEASAFIFLNIKRFYRFSTSYVIEPETREKAESF